MSDSSTFTTAIAFCLIWFSRPPPGLFKQLFWIALISAALHYSLTFNGVCGIDPVCTHPDFQRLGLGRAVVQRCFANQRAVGGQFSYIGSQPEPAPGTFLYRSLGPKSRTVSSAWTYDFG